MARASDPHDLRRAVQGFVRSFGLLSSSSTPCGKPISPSHAHALQVLLEHKRAGTRPSQGELAAQLGIDKSNVARLCARLEQGGHLERAPSNEDARVRRLALTTAGERLAREVEAASQERFAALLRAVPASRRGSVVETLELLTRAVLDSDPDTGGDDE